MRRSLFVSGLVVASLVALAGCGTKNNTTPAAPATAPATDKAPAAATAPAPDLKASKIGETISIGTVKFTVNGVRLTTANGDNKADDGYTYMIAEVTVENADKDVFFSNSLVQYSAKISTGMAFDRVAHKELKAPLDGQVAPGAKITGEIAFLVPTDAKGTVLIFRPNVLKVDEVARVALGDAK